MTKEVVMKSYKWLYIMLIILLYSSVSEAQTWLTGWDYRKALTIDHTKIDATLTDFPVLVKLTTSNFDFAKARSDGYDIRFTSSDGTTLLKYERERHNTISSKREYYDTGDDSHGSPQGNTWVTQTFTPSVSHRIKSVKIKVWRTGSPGTMTVTITSTSGGEPTGSILCSGTYDGNTVTTAEPGAWYEITLGDGANLSAGTQYSIVVKAPTGDSGNNLHWRCDTSSPTYSGGIYGYSSDAGSIWNMYPAYDCVFEEWGSIENAEYWVKIPSVSSTTNTIFYMYYGKSDASNGADVANVWNSNFKAVWHKKDATSSTIADATSNGINGTKKAINEPVQTEGLIGNAQSYDGNNDYISLGTGLFELGTGDLSITAWIKMTQQASNNVIIAKHSGSWPGFSLQIASNGRIRFEVQSGSPGWFDSNALLDTGQWYHIASVRNSGIGRIYINGVLDNSGNLPGNINNVSAITTISRYATVDDHYFHGIIDELRFSNTGHSQAWVKADYHSGNNSLIGYGSEELSIISPSVSTNSATSITSISATLNGNITDLGGDTDCDYRGFVWETSSLEDPGDTQPSSSSYSDYWTESGSFSTGTFNHGITSLNPGVTYYFRAFAHNTAGWSYGSELNFTTDAIPPNVTTQSATDITTTSAIGHGTITATGGASINEHGVCWSELENPTIADDHTEEGAIGTGSFISSITGLTPGHTYYYRAYATNSAGTSYGENQTFIAVASITVDWNNGNVQTITLQGDVQFEFINGIAGAKYELLVIQDEIGGYSVVLPINVKLPLDEISPIIPSEANRSIVFSFLYDGLDYRALNWKTFE